MPRTASGPHSSAEGSKASNEDKKMFSKEGETRDGKASGRESSAHSMYSTHGTHHAYAAMGTNHAGRPGRSKI